MEVKKILSNLKNKKGFYFTLDALFALTMLLVVISLLPYTSLSSIEAHYKMSYIQEDALQILSTIKTADINNNLINYIVNYSAYDNTLNREDLLVETLSKLWATNSSGWGYGGEGVSRLDNANYTAAVFFDGVLEPRDNFGIFFNNGSGIESVFMVNATPFTSAREIVNSQQFISGISKGREISGYSARAFLQKKEKTKIFYFGGYIGDGNITAVLDFSNITNVTNVSLELAINSPFSLSINGNNIGDYSGSSDPTLLIPVTIYLPDTSFGYFTNGTNLIDFKNASKKLAIAGGYIKILYKTSNPEYVLVKRQYLPGIEGIINLYDSMYSPDTINSMNARLHYKINVTADQNTTLSFRLGNTNIYVNKTQGSVNDFVRTITDSEISTVLSAVGLTYSNISNKTVPVRLGFAEFAGMGAGGNADVIVITDVSGSMGGRLIGGGTAYQRACDDAHLYDNDTERLALAKCLDKSFVNRLLNFTNMTGNRIATISFTTSIPDSHALSVNRETLNEQINSYDASGSTCICCAINEAWSLFDKPEVIIIAGKNKNSINWKSKVITSCGDSCAPNETMSSSGCNISNWYANNYDESSMTNVTTRDYRNNENGAVRYFRKHFYLPDPVIPVQGDGTLKVNSQRGFECYLNGNFIARDTSCRTISSSTSDPNTWPTWNVPNAFFQTGDNVLACRVRSGTSSNPNRRGTGFDAELNATTVSGNRNRFVLVMSDGQTWYRCTGTTCNQGTPYSSQCGNSQGNPYGTVNNNSCYNGTGTSGTSCGSDVADPLNPYSPGYIYFGAINNTVWSANRTFVEKNVMKIYTIGFVLGDRPYAWYTMNETAKIANGTFYLGNNGTELQKIYEEIANEIAQLSYSEQTANASGNFSSVLYNDSYIEYNYSTSSDGFGGLGFLGLGLGEGYDIETLRRFGNIITMESGPFDPMTGRDSFSFQEGYPLEVVVTSYSGSKWSKWLGIDNTSTSGDNFATVYNLNDYGSLYPTLGDPFRINIPVSNVGYNNAVKLTIANSSDEVYAGASDKIFYTILTLSNYSYSNVTNNAGGCNWTIQYRDGNSDNNYFTTPVAANYTGQDICYYSTDAGGSGGFSCANGTDNVLQDDAIAQATYLLLRKYDVNPADCVIDTKLSDYNVNAILLPSVPFLFYTRANFVSWR